MTIDPRVDTLVQEQPYPFLFVSVSGAHLYGFPSPDSDWDVRGVHVLPLREVVGLREGRETLEYSGVRDGVEMDLVTHAVRKFFRLLLQRPGYVLEQLYSPIVVRSSPEFEELKSLARGCVTRRHAHHYLGFARTQWDLFAKEQPRRVKPLLYVYRVLLTGIHLMRTGEIEANLPKLNESFGLPYLPDLIARKLAGPEKGAVGDEDVGFHEQEVKRLVEMLERESERSALPEAPSAEPALGDLLGRIRMAAR